MVIFRKDGSICEKIKLFEVKLRLEFTRASWIHSW